MVITAGERVAKVLQRDERLVEVFAAAAPAFERLRHPAMRHTMARLVTVEQAARMAGVDGAVLVERLNAALAEGADAYTPPAPGAPAGAGPETPEKDTMTDDLPTLVDMAAAFAALPPERVVDLDVREDLRNGQEPFSRIMAARQTLPEGGVLKLRAIFEPVPLYRVLQKQGLDHWTECLADDDWVVWFYPAAVLGEDGLRSSAVGDRSSVSDPLPSTDDRKPLPDDPSVIVLDVRGMEPPEPMVRTLAALEELPPGATLLQLNVRVPRFLLPKLGELGFTYEVREQNEELVRIFIRRRG